MRRKFKVGDKVKLNARAPKYVLCDYELRKRRERTVVDIANDLKWGYALYRIGHNYMGQGLAFIWLRSYCLNRVGSEMPAETPPELKLGVLPSPVDNGVDRGIKSPVARLRLRPGVLGVE